MGRFKLLALLILSDIALIAAAMAFLTLLIQGKVI